MSIANFARPLADMLSFTIMMKRETFPVADIYVPVKRRATLVQKRVDEIAGSMLEVGQQTPILVRADGARFVLVEGLHRLEAAQGTRRENHHRLPRGSAQALNGPPVVLAGDAAVVT
jgi:sulfiredoxin